jgi:hypothetical protein
MNEQKFFESMIDKPNTGCRLWSLSRDKDGYGYVSFNGLQTRAHRLAWTLANGPIPPGQCVCHRCDTPACCNPEHLFLGTNADNTADRHAKGRSQGKPTGWVTPPEVKAKQSEARKAFYERGGRNWNTGLAGTYTQSEESNEKRRAWSTGRKMSAETRAKISAAARQRGR